jgi:hypothetical protein
MFKVPEPLLEPGIFCNPEVFENFPGKLERIGARGRYNLAITDRRLGRVPVFSLVLRGLRFQIFQLIARVPAGIKVAFPTQESCSPTNGCDAIALPQDGPDQIGDWLVFASLPQGTAGKDKQVNIGRIDLFKDQVGKDSEIPHRSHRLPYKGKSEHFYIPKTMQPGGGQGNLPIGIFF